MAEPADLPPIDLGRTTCSEDGMRVEFFGPGRRAPVLVVTSHDCPLATPFWDRRAVATVHGEFERRIVELLPSGAVVDMDMDDGPYETGEDFGPLLDLALAAGLVLPDPKPAEAPDA